MKENGGIPPKATLTIRLLIGCYLLYIDYQIFSDVMARDVISKYVMLAIMVFFAVTGIVLIIFSAKALLGIRGNGTERGYGTKSESDAFAEESKKSSDAEEESEKKT